MLKKKKKKKPLQATNQFVLWRQVHIKTSQLLPYM